MGESRSVSLDTRPPTCTVGKSGDELWVGSSVLGVEPFRGQHCNFQTLTGPRRRSGIRFLSHPVLRAPTHAPGLLAAETAGAASSRPQHGRR